MTEMLINDKDIAMFSARLMTFNVSGTAVTNNTSAAGSLLSVPILYGCTIAPRTITVSLAFYPKELNGNSRKTTVAHRLHQAAENVVAFETELVGRIVEILLPDGYWYTCIYSGSSTADSDATGITDVTYTFSGIRHLPPVSCVVSSDGKVNCLSNTKTAFRLTLTCEEPLDSVTVCGITITGVTANTELMIDSVNGLITCGGVNKFNDCDLTDFPYLTAGENIIPCSATNAHIHVEYTPIFA